MGLELYLSIVHLALAVVGVVPLLSAGGRERFKLVSVGAFSLLSLIIVCEFFIAAGRRSEEIATKKNVVFMLRDRGDLGLDEICDGCTFHESIKLIDQALEELMGEGVVQKRPETVTGPDGRTHIVHVFSLGGKTLKALLPAVAPSGGPNQIGAIVQPTR